MIQLEAAGDEASFIQSIRADQFENVDFSFFASDEAFTRRLRFIIEIPLPDRNYRARIWRNIFPAETPCAKDIAFDFLAGKFEISGGNIKNIALNAAFQAAENSGVVSMKHIIRATRREFQKMGRMCVKSDFGEYYNLLEND